MKTILFPTDFSDNANNAVKFAIEIAEKSKAKLILFHAFWLPSYEYENPLENSSKERKLIKESLNELKKLSEQIFLSHPKIEIEVGVFNGLTADAIVKAASEFHADLIVMGTKGATGLKEIIMGSNTVDVITRSSVPVLAVPEKARDLGFSKIVFASDFYEDGNDKLEVLEKFADAFDAEVSIIHVDEAEEVVLETMDPKIPGSLRLDISPREKMKYVALKGEVVEELLKYLKENNVSLLAMVTSKKHFLTKLFGKSVTQKMAFHSSVPLMVFHR